MVAGCRRPSTHRLTCRDVLRKDRIGTALANRSPASPCRPHGPRRNGQSATSSSGELVSRRGGCSHFLGGLESCQHSSRRYPPDLRERAVRMVAEISDQHDSEWAPSVTWSWARARASRTAAATMRWLSTLNNSKFGTIWGPQMPREQVPSVRHGLPIGVQIPARMDRWSRRSPRRAPADGEPRRGW